MVVMKVDFRPGSLPWPLSGCEKLFVAMFVATSTSLIMFEFTSLYVHRIDLECAKLTHGCQVDMGFFALVLKSSWTARLRHSLVLVHLRESFAVPDF